jgi:7,8-dihydropterin-6-yl-methyl-4-(beta-D-ribofuranosyl)aminobenzene 5'-phosphate synthase
MMMIKKTTLMIILLIFLTSVPLVSADELVTLSILDLYDNTPVSQQGLKGDWGFSCLIKGTEKTILFDTGQKGSILMDNMKKLDISPSQIDIVVLSHIHPDHIGGLSSFLQKNRNVTLYVPQTFLDTKEFTKIIKKYSPKVVAITGPQPICENVYSTGEMNAKIYSSQINDESILVEQSLAIKTVNGLVVITGCGHPGIIEILDQAKNVVPGDLFYVIGGIHLLEQNKEYISEVVSEFKRLGVRYVSSSHCTGDLAIKMLQEEYQKNYIAMGVGKTIILEDL